MSDFDPREWFGVGRRPTQFGEPWKLLGKFRGKCVATNDPAMRGRIKALVPFPLGEVETDWAEPCFPPGLFVPAAIGDGVWIEFELGDPYMPIWSGTWYRNAEAPLQTWYTTLQKDDEESPDVLTPEEDSLHKHFHDHSQGQYYTPHVRGWQTPTGHAIMFDDWVAANGEKHGLIRIMDRNGRVIELSEEGYIDIYCGQDSWIRLNENNKIIVNAANVYLGDEANAQPLMTKADADSIKAALDSLKTHRHTGVSTGGGTSGTPTPTPPSYIEQVTTKVKGV